MSSSEVMSPPLRIRLFGNYAYPREGGVEVFTRTLADQLTERGHKVRLICVGNARQSITAEHAFDVNVLRGVNENTLSIPIYVSSTAKGDFDIVHATVPNPFTSIIAAMISLIHHRPLILTIMSFPTKHGPVSIYNYFLLPLLLRLSSAIVVPTYSFAFNGRLRSFFARFRYKLHRIPFMVDLQLFRGDVQDEVDLKGAEKIVLFVGVLDDQHWFKGLEYLLQALRILNEENKIFCKLVVVGDGDRRRHYEGLASRLGLTSSVKFLGNVPNKELPRVYNASSVLVLPSISETESFGIVLAEAMACGKPVIGSKIGGIPEVIGGCGLLVPPKNSRALAKAISEVLENEGLASSLGRKALKKVQLFSKERIATEYERLYMVLASTKDRSRQVNP